MKLYQPKTMQVGSSSSKQLSQSPSVPIIHIPKNRHLPPPKISLPFRVNPPDVVGFPPRVADDFQMSGSPSNSAVPRGLPSDECVGLKRRQNLLMLKDLSVRAEACRRAGRINSEATAYYCMGIIHDNMREYLKAVKCYQNVARSLQQRDVLHRQEVLSRTKLSQEDILLQASYGSSLSKDHSHHSPAAAAVDEYSYQDWNNRMKAPELNSLQAESERYCAVTLAVTFNSLGISYQLAGPKHSDRALYYHQLHLKSTGNDTQSKFCCYTNLGLVYTALGDIDRASDCHKNALRCAFKLKSQRKQRIAIGNLGLAGFQHKDYLTAEACMEAHLAMSHTVSGQCKATKVLGELAQQKGDYARAAHYLGQARVLAKQGTDLAEREKTTTELGVAIGQAKMEEYMRQAATYFDSS